MRCAEASSLTWPPALHGRRIMIPGLPCASTGLAWGSAGKSSSLPKQGILQSPTRKKPS